LKFVTRETCAKYESFFADLNHNMVMVQQKMTPEMNADALKVTGGWATFDGIGAFNTQIVGWGSSADVSDSEIEKVLEFYEGKPGNVKIELSMLSDSTLVSRLEDRGYRVRGWVVTAGKELREQVNPKESEDPFEFRLIEEKEENVWAETMIRGFENNEYGEIDKDVLKLSRVTSRCESHLPFIALENGRPVGAALLSVEGDLAYLVGASTIPSYRRRGIQTGLQKARIALAIQMGAKTLLFNGFPGTESLHNAYRQGMTSLYTSVLLSRHPIDNLAF